MVGHGGSVELGYDSCSSLDNVGGSGVAAIGRSSFVGGDGNV